MNSYNTSPYILITKDDTKYIMQKHLRNENWKEYWEPIYKYTLHKWVPVDNLDLIVLTSTTSGEFEEIFKGGTIEVIENLNHFLNEQMTEKFEEFL